MTRILIVDDEPAYRDSLRLLIPCEGYQVETAATADEAFDRATQFKPNILVIDWMLKERTDGLEVARKLCAADPHLKVIFITGYPTASLEARLRAFPAAQCLTKPFTLQSLIDAIRRL